MNTLNALNLEHLEYLKHNEHNEHLDYLGHFEHCEHFEHLEHLDTKSIMIKIITKIETVSSLIERNEDNQHHGSLHPSLISSFLMVGNMFPCLSVLCYVVAA